MRRRPEPSTRRGLLRAAGVVILLTVLLLAALFVVSSLTAPSAKAPTVPTTPGPISTVSPNQTPIKGARPLPTGTRLPVATPKATAKPTPQGKAALSASVIQRASRSSRADRVFWFTGHGDAYGGDTLHIRVPENRSLLLSPADPYVDPVWSADGRYVLYVRVREARRYPGAEWTLMQIDTRTGRSRQLARVFAMTLTPLGWSHGRVLYLAARSTDTSIYAVTSRGSRFVDILITQPITTARLSPDGQEIALAAPASCVYCTIDLYDLAGESLWNGPTGVPSESDMTWTRNSRDIVIRVRNELEAIGAESHDATRFALPRGLGIAWPHPLLAASSADRLTLLDRTTGATFEAPVVAGDK